MEGMKAQAFGRLTRERVGLPDPGAGTTAPVRPPMTEILSRLDEALKLAGDLHQTVAEAEAILVGPRPVPSLTEKPADPEEFASRDTILFELYARTQALKNFLFEIMVSAGRIRGCLK